MQSCNLCGLSYRQASLLLLWGSILIRSQIDSDETRDESDAEVILYGLALSWAPSSTCCSLDLTTVHDSSAKASVSSSLYESVEENGRTYHRYKEGSKSIIDHMNKLTLNDLSY